MFSPLSDYFAGEILSFETKPRSPATKAKSTAKVLIEDVPSNGAGHCGTYRTPSRSGVTGKVEPVILAGCIRRLLPEDFCEPSRC